MLRVIIYLLLFSFINIAADVSNATDEDFENNTMQTMQKFEEVARRQWELSVRKKPEAAADLSEHSQPSSSETIELFTWFPWFQENRPTIHTVKAVAAIAKENTSSFPVIIGVGTWQEITLYGKKRDSNSFQEPDASPLHNGSISVKTLTFTWFKIVIVCLICLFVL